MSLEWTTRCITAVFREETAGALDDEEKDSGEKGLCLAYDQFMFASVNVACYRSSPRYRRRTD